MGSLTQPPTWVVCLDRHSQLCPDVTRVTALCTYAPATGLLGKWVQGTTLKNCVGHTLTKKRYWAFSGGPGVESLPASAGDTGSTPGPGRSHMPQGS